jgi:DNA polymerase-3 subunit alpha
MLLAALDRMMADSQQIHKAKEIGQRSLFELSPYLMVSSATSPFALPNDVPGLAEKRRLADEKELLGVYMSSHPLEPLSQHIDDRLTAIADLDPSMDKRAVQVAGMVNALRVIATKKGAPMAFAQLEDLSGTVELTIFPRTYEETKELLGGDTPVLVQGKVDVRDESVKLIADSIEAYRVPANAKKRHPAHKKAKSLLVEIPLGHDERRDAEVVERVLSILTENQGDTPFSFHLRDRYGRVEMAFPNLLTAYSPQIEQQLAALVGPQRLIVEWA